MTTKKLEKIRANIKALSSDIIGDADIDNMTEQELIEKLKAIKPTCRTFNNWASRVVYEYEKYGF